MSQCITCLYAAIVGFCFAFVYDIVKSVRKSIVCDFLTVFVQDICVSLLLTLFTFLLLIARCNGEMRTYVFIFELIGFTIFRLIFSRYFIKISVKLIRLILKLKSYYSAKILLLSSLIESLSAKLSNFFKKIIKKCLIKTKNS